MLVLGFERRDDWQYFVWGSDLLFGTHEIWATEQGGLHLFANYPDIQIGPLSLVVAAVLRVAGDDVGRVLAAVLIVALGVLTVRLVEGIVEHLSASSGDDQRRRRHLLVLIGGLVAVYAWSELARYVHLDDALALFFMVLAVRGVARQQGSAGVHLGLAVAAKPWAVLALPLLLALGSKRRRGAAAATAIIALAYVPFVVADPGTVTAGEPVIDILPGSALTLLGFAEGEPPAWLRGAQLAVALTLGVVAVRRGRWLGVLLAGIGSRLLLDPGVFYYYSSGAVLAAFLFDLRDDRMPIPVLTVMTFVALNVIPGLGVGSKVDAVARMGCCASMIAVALFSDRLRIDGIRAGNRSLAPPLR